MWVLYRRDVISEKVDIWSLQALKKISQEHPTACLCAGALMAVLSYLDFFSTGDLGFRINLFREWLYLLLQMCKKLPSDVADFVMEAVPLFTNLLHYHDAKNEYNRGISSWNFDIEDLKSQASLIPDNEENLLGKDQGGCSNSLFELDTLQERISEISWKNGWHSVMK